MRRWIALVALLALPSAVFADEVELRSGRKITNCVAVEKDGKVVVEVGAGTITFDAKDVLSIKEADCPLREYAGRRAAVDGSTKASDWHDLAVWCQKNGLTRHVRGLLETTIELDPEHADARAALGYEKHEGKWLTVEQANEARGLVKFEGRWMSPIEVELIKARRLDELQRKLEKKRERESREQSWAEERVRQRQEELDRAAEVHRLMALHRQARRLVPRGGPWGGWWGAAIDTFDVVGFLQSKGYLPK